MFNLFKGISTKTYLIAIVVLTLAVFGLWKLYTHNLQDIGSLKHDNVVLEQNVKHSEQSAAITDKVVTDHVVVSKQSQTTNEQIRKEALNDYVKKIPADQAEAKAKDTVDNGDARVSLHAKRLHENYCRARPEDARCNPVSADPALHH